MNFNSAKLPIPPGGGRGLLKVAALGGAAVIALNSFFTIEEGQYGIVFNRACGFKEKVYPEGTHLKIPFIDRPIVYDASSQPSWFQRTLVCRDMTTVKVGLRVLTRPVPEKVPILCRNFGEDFNAKILPQIVQDSVKGIVSQYSSDQLMPQREVITKKIKNMMTRRAGYLDIAVDDLSITSIIVVKELPHGVEAKHVAAKEADKEERKAAAQKEAGKAANPDAPKKIKEAERAKKELEQQEYYDPRKIADEERERGDEFFKEQKYPEAIKHYTEALRRNPKDPRVYSNRAACHIKLGAMPEGLKDAEKCLKLDPTFTKGYTRKGAIQFFMKEYDKAKETYLAGLVLDPNDQELLDGFRRCIEQINKADRGEISQYLLETQMLAMPDPEIQKILADPIMWQNKAMQDPEIQNILADPIMRQVLIDLLEDPSAAQEHLKKPGVKQKVQKLVSAGIV